jgi:hypothetical protein
MDTYYNNITEILNSYSFNMMIFYFYFLFIIGGGYFINYLLYTIIEKQICRETNFTKQILHSINEKFEILDTSMIDELDYNKILDEMGKIKIN